MQFIADQSKKQLTLFFHQDIKRNENNPDKFLPLQGAYGHAQAWLLMSCQ
jgi:hypothetical protein